MWILAEAQTTALKSDLCGYSWREALPLSGPLLEDIEAFHKEGPGAGSANVVKSGESEGQEAGPSGEAGTGAGGGVETGIPGEESTGGDVQPSEAAPAPAAAAQGGAAAPAAPVEAMGDPVEGAFVTCDTCGAMAHPAFQRDGVSAAQLVSGLEGGRAGAEAGKQGEQAAGGEGKADANSTETQSATTTAAGSLGPELRQRLERAVEGDEAVASAWFCPLCCLVCPPVAQLLALLESKQLEVPTWYGHDPPPPVPEQHAVAAPTSARGRGGRRVTRGERAVASGPTEARGRGRGRGRGRARGRGRPRGRGRGRGNGGGAGRGAGVAAHPTAAARTAAAPGGGEGGVPHGGGHWGHVSAPFPPGTAPMGALRPSPGALWQQQQQQSQSHAHAQHMHRLQQLHHLQQMQAQMQQQHRMLSMQQGMAEQAGAQVPTSMQGAPRVLDEQALARARNMHAQMQAQLQAHMQAQMQRMQDQGPHPVQAQAAPGQGVGRAPATLARARGAPVASAPTNPASTQAPHSGPDPRHP